MGAVKPSTSGLPLRTCRVQVQVILTFARKLAILLLATDRVPFLGTRGKSRRSPFFALLRNPTVYLLYLDESGNESDPADRYFVLGGIALFERQTFFLTRKFDAIQQHHFPGQPPIPFHATEMRAGKGFWRNVPREKREEVLSDIGASIRRVRGPGLMLRLRLSLVSHSAGSRRVRPVGR